MNCIPYTKISLGQIVLSSYILKIIDLKRIVISLLCIFQRTFQSIIIPKYLPLVILFFFFGNYNNLNEYLVYYKNVVKRYVHFVNRECDKFTFFIFKINFNFVNSLKTLFTLIISIFFTLDQVPLEKSQNVSSTNVIICPSIFILQKSLI